MKIAMAIVGLIASFVVMSWAGVPSGAALLIALVVGAAILFGNFAGSGSKSGGGLLGGLGSWISGMITLILVLAGVYFGWQYFKVKLPATTKRLPSAERIDTKISDVADRGNNWVSYYANDTEPRVIELNPASRSFHLQIPDKSTTDQVRLSAGNGSSKEWVLFRRAQPAFDKNGAPVIDVNDIDGDGDRKEQVTSTLFEIITTTSGAEIWVYVSKITELPMPAIYTTLEVGGEKGTISLHTDKIHPAEVTGKANGYIGVVEVWYDFHNKYKR